MVQQLQPDASTTVNYPDSDGQPMADNTKQFRWIVVIKENLELLFVNEPEVSRWTLINGFCHVERSEAKSRHLGR